MLVRAGLCLHWPAWSGYSQRRQSFTRLSGNSHSSCGPACQAGLNRKHINACVRQWHNKGQAQVITQQLVSRADQLRHNIVMYFHSAGMQQHISQVTVRWRTSKCKGSAWDLPAPIQ
jgi:hypothetical protein